MVDDIVAEYNQILKKLYQEDNLPQHLIGPPLITDYMVSIVLTCFNMFEFRNLIASLSILTLLSFLFVVQCPYQQTRCLLAEHLVSYVLILSEEHSGCLASYQ